MYLFVIRIKFLHEFAVCSLLELNQRLFVPTLLTLYTCKGSTGVSLMGTSDTSNTSSAAYNGRCSDKPLTDNGVPLHSVQLNRFSYLHRAKIQEEVDNKMEIVFPERILLFL